jgi:hypothetical protein
MSWQWHDFDQEFKFQDLENDLANGFYYIGYYEDDLVGQAVNKRITLGRAPCQSCNRYNTNAYNKYSQYVRFRTFSVSSNNVPPVGEMWDTNRMGYHVDTNWGLNFQIKTNCDISDEVVMKKEVFADMACAQLRVDILTEIAHSYRQNNISEVVKANARGALQPTHLGGEGEQGKLTKAINSAIMEIADIRANVCAPREKSKGITSSSIGANRPRRL